MFQKNIKIKLKNIIINQTQYNKYIIHINYTHLYSFLIFKSNIKKILLHKFHTI
jgi:hypothetical protein